jgi:hypothetical protein
MTKAEHVLKLLGTGKTDKQIAAIVGCSESYVRYNRNREANLESRNRYARNLYATGVAIPGARKAASEAARKAYLAARKKGASVLEARMLRGPAYNATIRKFAMAQKSAA